MKNECTKIPERLKALAELKEQGEFLVDKLMENLPLVTKALEDYRDKEKENDDSFVGTIDRDIESGILQDILNEIEKTNRAHVEYFRKLTRFPNDQSH